MGTQSASFSGLSLPEAAVFRPTMEQFADPMKYISSISQAGMPYGIIKVIPPTGWSPPCGLDASCAQQTFCTRLQRLHLLGQGEPFPDGRSYKLQEYKVMADAFKARFPEFQPTQENLTAAAKERGLAAPQASRMSSHELLTHRMEAKYWSTIEQGTPGLEVEYGNDQDTETYSSGFLKRACFARVGSRKVGVGGMGGTTLEAQDYAVVGHAHRNTVEENPLSVGLKSSVHPRFGDSEYYRETGWNLNNMPHLPSSLLRLVSEAVGGINVPWLYMGMLFSTFCWHVEDNYLFSINYMHHGEAKCWYGVPGSDAPAFESVMKAHLHEKFKSDPDLLFQLTTMLSPSTLTAAGVNVVRTVQHPGEFIITMPRAYHGGFSLGFNIAEACNFALTEWIPWGRKAIEVYRSAAAPRASVFCHEKLMLDLARWALSPKAEFTKAQLTTIADEVHTVLRCEVRERKALDAHGFGEGCRFFVQNDADARGECVKCRKACYLSAVLCRTCGTAKMACPRHHLYLCGCDPSPHGKLLLYWHTIRDIADLEAQLRSKVAMVSTPPMKAIAAAATAYAAASERQSRPSVVTPPRHAAGVQF